MTTSIIGITAIGAVTTPHVIVSAASAVEPKGGRINGLAPMTSCTLWKPPPPCSAPRLLLAKGYERVPITIMGQCLVLAVGALREQYGEDAPVVCITETDEVWSTACDRVQQAEALGRMTGDGLPTWCDLHELAASPGIIHREPWTPREGFWVKECRLKARAIRSEVLADYAIERQAECHAAVLMLPGITWSEWVPAPSRFLAD